MINLKKVNEKEKDIKKDPKDANLVDLFLLVLSKEFKKQNVLIFMIPKS